MIRTDLGIATAYAEAVSKGYTGTRDEFGELLANAVKNAKQVAEDRVAVEAAKKSVDQTVETFDSHVAEKTAEATEAISEHAEVAQTAAENAINDAKDAGVSAVNTASETGVNNVNTAVEEGKKNFETDETLELSGRAADAAVTGEKINDLKKDIYFSKRPIGQAPAIISFIDDDCRIETYNKILPLMKESKVPWGIACPVGQLGTDTFMSVDQLKEMIAAGATVLSHHQKQYAMNQFQNRTEYENELSRTDAAFKAIGLEPKSICYPNGICVDGYMDIVKDHYDYGFTVDRGVNAIPLESLFLKRVEVFPTSEIYTFDDVKKYVDNIKDGEWLIFMTHAWYTTFDSAKLTELINYVKNKSISIVSVDEGMSRVGNLEEHGIIKKPLEYMSTPFYCVDKTGVVHTNNQKFYQKSNEKLTNINPGWNAGYNLTVNGATPAASSKSRLVSVKVTVKPGETYLISASNVYGNALYCIYDESDVVIAYEASENTADGTVITKKRITIPENASYMKIASNIAAQPGGYEMLKAETVAVDYDFVPAGKKDVDSLKEDNVTLSSKLEKNEKRAERAEATAQYAIKMQQGYTYEYKTVVGSGSEIDVPIGSRDYAGLKKIGCMSRKGYQMLLDDFPASNSQLSVTKNGNYNYTLTTLSTGSYRQNSKTINMTGLGGMYMLHAQIVGTGGLIVRFYSLNGKNIAETIIVSGDQEKTISVAEDFVKIVLVFLGNRGDEVPIGTVTTISGIMLEFGNTAHRWEPYTTDLIEAPVDSVVSKKKSGEVIHTTALPPEMLALCPDYGQGTTESYNYIDFEAKSYHHVGSMTQNGVWTALDTTEIIDLSAAWPDDLEILTVASGGTVQMHYPKLDDDFEVAVPSETVFLVEIAKVI